MVSSGTVRGAVDTLDTLDTLATPLTARGACHELRGRSGHIPINFSRLLLLRTTLPACCGAAESRGVSFTTASRDPPRISLCCAGISPRPSRTAREQTVACLGAQSV